MVEPLKELNRICQKPRYKEVGNWMVRHILRDAALPVTWVLLHTPITANQVTLISLIVGLIGIIFFALPPFFFLIGTLLLQLWYLLDHVDGQIARYRKTASLTGRFFDFMMHHIIHISILFSLGVYSFFLTQQFLFVLWGFVSSVALLVFNLIHDVKYKTFFERLAVLEKPFSVRSSDACQSMNGAKEFTVSRKVFSVLHKACEVHVLMNILTLAALLQVFTSLSLDLRFFLFLFYGIAAPLLAVVKLSYLIGGKKIDEEFQSQFMNSSF